jgi:3-deoxy-D-manno-octulosonic-acid transferase
MRPPPLLLNAIYLLAALASAPWWMRKTRGGWDERFGKIDRLPEPTAGRPRLLIHAVSVGEVNLIAPLVDRLARDADIVISTTTDTGIARARKAYEGRAHVVRYPLDATWAVRRFLDAVRPDAVALTELELWPNFIRACERRSVPVGVINGRLSARSFRNYRAARGVVGWMFEQLAFAAVQNDDYAARFIEMGVPKDRCHVVDTMKWDAAVSAVERADADALAVGMGLDPALPLVVAGSTAPDEHELIRDAVAHASRELDAPIQLLCAPRRPEWFNDAAADLPGCVRRSRPGSGDPTSHLFLLDTIGELSNAYALAHLAIVGRSFGDLHGSDPMQPAALGSAVVIGPAVGDFERTVEALRDEWAIVQTTREGLSHTLARWLADDEGRAQMGARAALCVEHHRGATKRNAQLIITMLAPREGVEQ